ncbi:MerR family DNA-binding transcriptional regulator [Vagococcus carniphilus]|uniref:MerR family DNA-binding transcriptional regulator n=1 Tax=Vagococcus carniphilus TaxID=218144 RepID=UPI003BACAF5B
MNLMSIGELAKASGISIRALRYYDKKGYLKPDYINPETNYRYYSSNQFGKLIVLQLFAEFDVPLSEIENYEKEKNQFDTKELIQKIESQIKEKLDYYQSQQIRIEALKENIHRLQRIKALANRDNYQELFPIRHIVIKEFSFEDPSYFDFTEMTVDLYNIAFKNKLIPLFNRGVFKIQTPDIERKFGFLEIKTIDFNESQQKVTYSFPTGTYLCNLSTFDMFYSNLETFWNKKLKPNTVLICNGLYDLNHQVTASYIETQELSY